MVKIENELGMISITSEVFTTIASDAATNCFGVKGMGARSKSDGLVHLLRRESMSRGVSVSFNDDNSVSIALHIVVDHGVNIKILAGSIMNEVSYKVGRATGVPVTNVDVFIDSMQVS
ncbi:MAG: Asp23/Gls24 family envelope stress response protein [Oscillospiraceae bacterium]